MTVSTRIATAPVSCALGRGMATAARATVVVAALIAASACDMTGIPRVAEPTPAR